MSFRAFPGLFRTGDKKTLPRCHAFLAAINIKLELAAINDAIEESEFGLSEKGTVAECGTGANRDDVHTYGELPWSTH